MLEQAQRTDLSNLLERIPQMLHADQQRCVDPSIVSAIDSLAPIHKNAGDLSPREQIALGNYYFTKGQPVQALQCYWLAVQDRDPAVQTVAKNNLGVVHFGFCPGMFSTMLLEETL